jgi:hypothetical protein
MYESKNIIKILYKNIITIRIYYPTCMNLRIL